MSSAATTVPLILLFIYTPIIVVLYSAQVALVIINKRKAQFRSSYFSLFIVEAISGLGTVVITLITDKLILYPEVNSFYVGFPSNAVTTALYFSSYYFPACQEYTNICIALNRLSALAFYDKYEKMWSLLGWLCLPVIFGFPFISYYHLVDVKAVVNWRNNGTLFSFDYDHSLRPWRSNRVQSFYLFLICSVISLVLNLSTIIVLRCMSMEKVSSIEIRLFLLGFSSFACGLPMTIQQLSLFTMSYDDLLSTFFLRSWLFDLKALSPAILSLIFSTAIRNELRRTLPGRRSTNVSWMN